MRACARACMCACACVHVCMCARACVYVRACMWVDGWVGGWVCACTWMEVLPEGGEGVRSEGGLAAGPHIFMGGSHAHRNIQKYLGNIFILGNIFNIFILGNIFIMYS